MSEKTNSPAVGFDVIEDAVDNMPENFLESVFNKDDKVEEVSNDVVESEEELEEVVTPTDESEDEAVEETVEEDSVEDEFDDETESDSEVSDEELTDEEVWDINDLDTNQVIRFEDGTEGTVKDLIDGRFRQSDYTKKTQALAEERKTLEAEKVRVGEQSDRVVSEHLQIAREWEAELEEAAEQYRSNPSNPEAKQRYDIAQVNLQGAVKQYEETEAVYSEQIVEASTKRIQEANNFGVENIEGWSNELAQDLLDYTAEAAGASKEDILAIVSGPMLQIVHKAMMYDKGAKVATKKRTLAKKTGKSLKTNASKAKKTNRTSQDKQAKALKDYEQGGDFANLDDIFGADFEKSVFNS